MATGETFKATIIGELTDHTAIVFDFGYVDDASGSVHLDTGTAAGNFQTLVQAKFAAVLCSDFTFRRYRFACTLGVHKGEIGYVEVDPAVNGALDPLDRLPNEVCIAMKRMTGHASRRDRGRIFFGPLSKNFAVSADQNVPSTNGDLDQVRDLLKANLVTGGVTLKPVILSAAGTYSGRLVNRVAYNTIYVHRKSRRPRPGV